MVFPRKLRTSRQPAVGDATPSDSTPVLGGAVEFDDSSDCENVSDSEEGTAHDTPKPDDDDESDDTAELDNKFDFGCYDNADHYNASYGRRPGEFDDLDEPGEGSKDDDAANTGKDLGNDEGVEKDEDASVCAFPIEREARAKKKVFQDGVFKVTDRWQKPFAFMRLARELRNKVYETYIDETKPYSHLEDPNKSRAFEGLEYIGDYPEGLFKPFSYTHRLVNPHDSDRNILRLFSIICSPL